MVPGVWPTHSMTSISPHAGQLTVEMSLPRAQKAGQHPIPAGTRARASSRPYLKEKFVAVFIRAEV